MEYRMPRLAWNLDKWWIFFYITTIKIICYLSEKQIKLAFSILFAASGNSIDQGNGFGSEQTVKITAQKPHLLVQTVGQIIYYLLEYSC